MLAAVAKAIIRNDISIQCSLKPMACPLNLQTNKLEFPDSEWLITRFNS